MIFGIIILCLLSITLLVMAVSTIFNFKEMISISVKN